MQIKTTLRFYLTPVRIASRILPPQMLLRMWGKKETSYTAGGNVS
jgi:hypothetical protein